MTSTENTPEVEAAVEVEKSPEVEKVAVKSTEESPEESPVEEAKKVEVEKDEVFAPDEKLICPKSLAFNDADATFNAHISNRNCLFSVQADGFNQLFAGTRANTGFKSGRYYFEMKMLDQPRLVRLGFACIEADLSLEDKHSFSFDATGNAYMGGERASQVCPRWSRTDVVGVLLNIPKKTITLFLNGMRPPQANHETRIPDEMFDGDVLKAGCELFPVVASRGSAVECNFSTRVWKQIPFVVRPIGKAKKSDVVASTRKKPSLSEKNKSENTVDITIPVGFDVRDVIKQWQKENPDGMVLTQDALCHWAEKSGLQKQSNRNHQRGAAVPQPTDKYNVQCLDNPMGVYPMLLRGGRKYLMSLSNYHNLHPQQRTDICLKLRHSLNAHITAYVSVDEIVSVVDEGKAVIQQVREFYEQVKMPQDDEDFNDVFFHTEKYGEGKSKAELGEFVRAKFQAWKKDCKLKSKVTDLKKSTFFATNMGKFQKLKQFQHKSTAESARKQYEKELEAKKTEKAAKAKAKKLAEEKALEEAGLEKKEGEEEKEESPVVEDNNDDDAAEPLPDVLEEFSEEDWMLAQLRAEIHTVIHAFKKDVHDEERLSFPAVHFGFYFQLYTGKNFGNTLQMFSCKNLEELTRLVPDICKHTSVMDEFELRKHKECLIADYDLVLPAFPIDSEMSVFVAETEAQRSLRTDRLDAGDENAALNFSYLKQRMRDNMMANNGKVNNMANGMGQNANMGGGQNATHTRGGMNGSAVTGNGSGGHVAGNYKRPVASNPQTSYDYAAKRARGGAYGGRR